MTVGVCYFPEHWPRERWERDVEQMAAAGLDYVRMGEFAWSRLEPARGEFDFEWLETVVDLVTNHGMEAILCTPTATPPKWLVDEHPEIRQEEPDGTPRAFGSRRHYCFNSDVYRRETERIVTRLTENFIDHPGVAGWQLDNEYGCHGTVRCYCDDCAEAFREWLRQKYGDVETLNEAWGTAFWGQEHTEFAEVDPPRHTAAEHHPSRLLDYARFASDSVVDYNRLQADLVRAADDDWLVAHNFMGSFETLNARDVAADLDIVTWDSYPTGFVQDRREGEPTRAEFRVGDPDQVGLNHDLYRGALGAPFWVMEQQPGDINWPPHAPQPGKGAMRLWAHHATAHGADEVFYFRWRRCQFGQEQYHAGLRKQDGSPDRGYVDANEVSSDLDDLDGWYGETVGAPVALLFEYDNWWALSEQPHSPDFDYWSHLKTWYSALRKHGVPVDIAAPDNNLSDYDLAVAPSLYLVGPDIVDSLEYAVDAGTNLLFGPRTGEKDRNNKLHEDLQPGPLASLAGGSVAQHESLPDTLDSKLTYQGEVYEFMTWAEWLDPEMATVYGEHQSGAADGEPAIMQANHERGSVTYCGVWPSADLASELLADELDSAGITRTPLLPDGVRVTPVEAVLVGVPEWSLTGLAPSVGDTDLLV